MVNKSAHDDCSSSRPNRVTFSSSYESYAWLRKLIVGRECVRTDIEFSSHQIASFGEFVNINEYPRTAVNISECLRQYVQQDIITDEICTAPATLGRQTINSDHKRTPTSARFMIT
jgi:hypothetical protein